MNQPLITLNNIHFGFRNHPVFMGLNLELNAGDRLALVGDNGAGKSSLLQLIVGLRPVLSGDIRVLEQSVVSEKDFRDVRQRVGLLFQDSDDQLFCPTVIEDVLFGPRNQGLSSQEALHRAQATLAELGIESLSDRVTHQLSGGQKRLVALATILAMKPDVLLLDEPTNGLDSNAEEILVQHLAKLDLTMILVSHDKHLIGKLANRAVILQDGKIIPAVMHSHPHQHQHNHIHIHPAPDLEELHSSQTAPIHPDHHQTTEE